MNRTFPSSRSHPCSHSARPWRRQPSQWQRPCSGGRPTRAVTTSASTTTVIERGCAKVSATPAVDAGRTIAARMSTAAAATATAGASGTRTRSNADVFRRGFAEGYQAGYQRFRGSYGGYGLSRGAYPRQAGMRYPGGELSEPEWLYGYPAAVRVAGSAARLRGRLQRRPQRRSRQRSLRAHAQEEVPRGRRRLQQPLRVAGPVPERLSPGVPAGIRPRLSRGPLPLSKVSAARCRLT